MNIPKWVWGVVALVVIIIIVVIIIVVVTAAPSYRIKSLWGGAENGNSINYLDISDGQLIVSPVGEKFSLALNDAGTAYYVKSATNPSKVITAVNGTANMAKLSVVTNTNADNQAWIIQPALADPNLDIFTSGMTLVFIPSSDTTKSMNLLGTVQPTNSPVGLYDKGTNTGLNQQWVLVPYTH
jgi:hypothetical protein